MRGEPQAASYRPDPAILELSDWLGDPVEAADFPETRLRFRNDRHAASIGLAGMSDEEWVAHFGRFEPLEDNLPQPLALRYHGHQFRVYNPELGDGRGFLFAQMRDGQDRLLDLGTKGSGRTPWSREGDGRLTLKGAVREILATEMLEALGVYTSKTFSVVETGEALQRGDEPSPTRSAVMTRLSHGHIRIGTFQRLAVFEQRDHMAQLVDYCLHRFPGPAASGTDENPAATLLGQVVERLADLAASWMVAGFVHGVLNSDNMNISGESFDYGPWRFAPRWDPGFTAAYFDHQGLYAFGRQPEALHWNCGQLALALRQLSDAPPLIAAMERFGPAYMEAIGRRWCWRLGVESRGAEEDAALVAASEAHLRESSESPDAFFFRHRGGRGAQGSLAEALAAYQLLDTSHDYWSEEQPQSMLIEEVESIWSAIDQRDDWSVLEAKVAALRRMGEAHGIPPGPLGHAG
ncbi:protein adenylyltransferase SelO family protein [Qipengyuania soli]|uniref:Protein nucleotidyltransferase YdiU n=1 Tax=Qipengyuania soli TaxID=2782568 RepID=A0A7S8IVH7_9SPHN|nr:YdiU family protein [Qipengyuania soli]QPC99615.1 YdiU family protein [Qipengyuania soli]